MKYQSLLKASVACVLAHLANMSTSFANTPPPTVDESISSSRRSWQATSKPSAGLRMGNLEVKLERTTLAEIVAATNLGTIRHRGDAGESVYWLCYTVVENEKAARVWIQASGEMGGPEHDVTEIAVRSIANHPLASDCPVLPKQFSKLSFGNGVSLGASKVEVGNLLGSGMISSGSQSFIGYHGKESGDGQCDGGYDLLNSLFLTFEAGVVVGIDAGQVTSC